MENIKIYLIRTTRYHFIPTVMMGQERIWENSILPVRYIIITKYG